MIKEYILKKDLMYVVGMAGTAIGIDSESIAALKNVIDVYPSRETRTFVAECLIDDRDFAENKNRAEAYIRSVIAGHFREAVEPYLKITYEDIKETGQRRAHGELEVLL